MRARPLQGPARGLCRKTPAAAGARRWRVATCGQWTSRADLGTPNGLRPGSRTLGVRSSTGLAATASRTRNRPPSATRSSFRRGDPPPPRKGSPSSRKGWRASPPTACRRRSDSARGAAARLPDRGIEDGFDGATHRPRGGKARHPQGWRAFLCACEGPAPRGHEGSLRGVTRRASRWEAAPPPTGQAASSRRQPQGERPGSDARWVVRSAPAGRVPIGPCWRSRASVKRS